MDKRIQDLMNLGLTEGEAKVYVALLKTGSSTIGPIVKESRVASSNIYEILDRLLEKGIVSFVIKSKTKYFQAAPPVNIGDYLQKKQKMIEDEKKIFDHILPDLNKITMEESQHAEVFVGIKGLKTAYEKLTSNMTKKDVPLYLYDLPLGKVSEMADDFYLTYFDKKFKALGLKNKGICNEQYRKSRYVKKTGWGNIRFVGFPIPMNIDIYQDKVLIVSWKDAKSTISILITASGIADQFRKYFYAMWKIAKA